MNDEQKTAVRKSNRERSLRCGKCAAIGIKVLDGSRIGGLPGLAYKVCDSCGWSRAITKRQGREKLRTA